LSYDILKRSRKDSLYTIAHELAHVYLKIPKTASMLEDFSGIEKEIDEQLIKWNFETELRQTPFSYICGDGKKNNESSVDAI